MLANSAPLGDDRKILIPVLLVILGVGLIVCLQPGFAPTAYQRSMSELQDALQNRRSTAFPLAQKHLEAFPDDPLGLVLAAQSAVQNGDHALALEFYQRLPADGGRWEFQAQIGLARRFENLGKIAAAEQHLRHALELNPVDIEANNRLGYLLQNQGRTWESAKHFFLQIQRGKCRGDELLGMATPERFFQNDERLEEIGLRAIPQEVVVKLAMARRALYDNRGIEAEGLLREVLATRPDLGEAQGRLGRIIVDRGDSAEFLQWLANIPNSARQHPEIWFAQGLQARRLGQMEGAVTCFLETLLLSPNHLSANVQIASCLERLGKKDAAREFATRGEHLSDLETRLNEVRASVNVDNLSKTITLLGSLGRYWEAAGWSNVMTFLDKPPENTRSEIQRWLSLARAEPGPNAPSQLPTRLLNRADFASPVWPGATGKTQSDLPKVVTTADIGSERAWNFVDDAERLGIRFQYYEGTTEKNRMLHIFNTMGGGLGAIDFDLDGWPDLYLAQANNWRNSELQPEYFDRMYRNAAGETFQDVTVAARMEELSFSHGVTVGDFDQDGFPDVYIGNAGPNRLFHNNGDGTFTDVTSAASVAGNEWTTSSVFADLNDDSLPDLYVLNYSLLKETMAKECTTGDGRPMACSPDRLVAETDRCYLNLGDGRFQDISKQAGILLPEGKGLGVIVWDFAGDGRMGMFVANDTTPNFLLLRDGQDTDGIPHFQDEALVRGVGVDGDGHAQASMGVAAGDANADGRIDLFVTTFFGESKTLFSQREGGFFEDLSRPFNLRDAGFWMLGFGCQFADLDGDGWEDLIATNGHVDQRAINGDPDRMPPQIFHNLRGQRFAEVPAAALGKFFQGKYLGRGLATLDWNRDGRTDFGISHLHAPFALVTNQTQHNTRPLVVRLVGRTGTREPTGATVRVTAELESSAANTDSNRSKPTNQQMVRLQTAGDGFLATNERRHQFSLPSNQSAAQVEVRWPGGKIQRWQGVPAGHEVLLIEDRVNPVSLRQFP